MREDLFDILFQFVLFAAPSFGFCQPPEGKKLSSAANNFAVVSSSLSICALAIDVDKLPLLVRSQRFNPPDSDDATENIMRLDEIVKIRNQLTEISP